MISTRFDIVIVILFSLILQQSTNFAEQIHELPDCSSDTNTGYILVSTLDGKLSAINSTGSLLWSFDTGPGPLLTSNIHDIELTNNGEWVRIIPSLSGSLYKFNGKTIDAIPITADSLLKSSFVYSNDLVIAGGHMVVTYGVGSQGGKILYECTLTGCYNKTDSKRNEFEDVIVLERTTTTIRAHEPRTGLERWNFSVGHHNVKIPYTNCIASDPEILQLNLTAILPEGILNAHNMNMNNNKIWQCKFLSPIVKVWTWDGKDLKQVDLFNVVRPADHSISLPPAIYLGMHLKQLYIYESARMLNSLHVNSMETDVIESKSLTKIPWKPITATNLERDKDDSTALSILYNSEYVNGNGYYLYTETDITGDICKSNKSNLKSNISIEDIAGDMGVISKNLWYYWKEIILISISTAVAVNIFLNYSTVKFLAVFNKHSDATNVTTECKSDSNNHIVNLSRDSIDSSRTNSESLDTEAYKSRYLDDFDVVRCLGKGGYGVVFEVRKKFDECRYAIKRITLPQDIIDKKSSWDRVMREVRALANLEHVNIVRYFNSWIERHPVDWNVNFDTTYLCDSSYISTSISPEESKSLKIKPTHKRNNSTIISIDEDTLFYKNENSNSCDIVFEDSEKKQDTQATLSDLESHSAKTEVTFSEEKTDSKRTCLAGKQTIVYLYIQMQLCQKDSLKEWLLANSVRNKLEIYSIYKQILSAVIYVHGKNLIHRDLKPSNIFFSQDGNIKIGDFGLVIAMSDYDSDTPLHKISQKSHTKGAGTMLYMSPEQLNGERYNFMVDIFSLGVILFELLVPFHTEMERHISLTDLRKGKYPCDFQHKYPQEYDLLLRMLAEKPKSRPNAQQVANVIEVLK